LVIQKNTDAATKKNTIVYPAEDRRRHSRDNKNLDYISSWSNSDLEHTYVKITKLLYHTYAQSDVYKIDPVMEQMLITCVWPLRCIKDMKLVMDYVVNHWGIEHWMMKIYQHKTGFINLKTIRKRTINALINDSNASKIDTEICLNGWFVNQCLI
jgi:hypothetical protein